MVASTENASITSAMGRQLARCTEARQRCAHRTDAELPDAEQRRRRSGDPARRAHGERGRARHQHAGRQRDDEQRRQHDRQPPLPRRGDHQRRAAEQLQGHPHPQQRARGDPADGQAHHLTAEHDPGPVHGEHERELLGREAEAVLEDERGRRDVGEQGPEGEAQGQDGGHERPPHERAPGPRPAERARRPRPASSTGSVSGSRRSANPTTHRPSSVSAPNTPRQSVSRRS